MFAWWVEFITSLVSQAEDTVWESLLGSCSYLVHEWLIYLAMDVVSKTGHSDTILIWYRLQQFKKKRIPTVCLGLLVFIHNIWQTCTICTTLDVCVLIFMISPLLLAVDSRGEDYSRVVKVSFCGWCEGLYHISGFNQTSWMAFVHLTVLSRSESKILVACVCCHFAFLISCWSRVFCHRTGSDIFAFLCKADWYFYYVYIAGQ